MVDVDDVEFTAAATAFCGSVVATGTVVADDGAAAAGAATVVTGTAVTVIDCEAAADAYMSVPD